MFCAVYRFSVKPGADAPFKEAWRRLTELIYEYEGSLGSRLHSCGVDGEYIAYAQWPSRETWERASGIPAELADAPKKSMREACIKIETIHELEVVDDLLKTETA